MKSYARIHRQNLLNFGILPFTFVNPSDYDKIDQGDELSIPHLRQHLIDHKKITVHNKTKNENYEIAHGLTDRQIEIVLAGGIIALHRRHLQS